ncbi:MAG: ABC transporter ATP-binding protein [Actinomycetota bacterium]
MPGEPIPAVALTGLTKRFDEVVAVDGVDLDIADGEFFALLGPSGCGKTTTLRMIAGLDVPTEGSLKIFGDEVGTLAANKRPVNTVFQAYALFPHMTVLDNVAFGPRMNKVAKAEARAMADDALAMVRLDGYEARKPSQLSGGQQQRVALARALVNQPKVLLLDEPLGALDLKLRQEMQQELKSLQRDLGITFVFVTHDQEEALTMSDRIAVMDQGKLLQVGTPTEIYERPVNRFVADFIGQSNLLEATGDTYETVCLANGMRLMARGPGTHIGDKVAISLRPERARLHQRGEAPEEHPSVDGRLEGTTYLGNAMVHTVALDWMTIEVRLENSRPQGADNWTPQPGDKVSVSWDPDSVVVVAD